MVERPNHSWCCERGVSEAGAAARSVVPHGTRGWPSRPFRSESPEWEARKSGTRGEGLLTSDFRLRFQSTFRKRNATSGREISTCVNRRQRICTRAKHSDGRERPHFCAGRAAQKVCGVAPARHRGTVTVFCPRAYRDVIDLNTEKK
jgi:hypothetical protein